MDTKSINKIKLPKKTVENIVEKYIKDRVEKLITDYYEALVENLMSKKSKGRYTYLKNKDVYYDFLTGHIFPNFYSKEGFENNMFSDFQGREMEEEESNLFRKNFPKLDSRKIYVDCQMEESGDGESWESAVKTIKEAMALAKDNDEILIAEGVYPEEVVLKSNISIHGGYKRGEENLFVVPEKETFITGRVFLNQIQNVKLSFLTITVTSGNALDIRETQNFECYDLKLKDNIYNNYGSSPSAIFIHNNCSGEFYSCHIENNSVTYNSSNYTYGGAIYIYNSTINFINCNLKNNKNINTYSCGYEYGGAIYIERGNLKTINCNFNNNSANYGRDIFNNGATIQIVGNNINSYNNSVSYIQYKDLDEILRNKIESLNKKYPIYDLVKEFEDSKKVFNTLVDSSLIDLSEVRVQNTFLRENFTLEDGFLIDRIYNKLLDNIFELNLDGEGLNKKSVYSRIESGEFKIPADSIYDIFLNSDASRINIIPYDKKILEDITRGHWDLWENNLQGDIEVSLDTELVARNPKEDINYNGIVAIDFGTKSTVVVYQKDDDTTYIKRIGADNLEAKVENKDYENPTVLEFRNLKKFLEDYKGRAGRPDTLWEDLTSSYTANNRIFDDSSDNFYSFLSDLKQWAGSDKKKKIRDKQGNSWDLPLFSELDLEKDINPIEIYAYYIGLAINNMHGDGIFIDYILSFPVKYEKELCEKIVKSFERGLKKSLPCSILEDEEIMKKFKVRIGASEPAAYAVCALQEYGFEPEGEEEIAYGIFDFGGGTTDFDFGVWREPKKGSYDFEIEHFYDNGDRYLGGENILQLLAFEIFKDESNQEELKKKGITFTLPPECIAYPGSETLIVNSQEAEKNTKILMEECRYFWEHNGEKFCSSEADTNEVVPSEVSENEAKDKKEEIEFASEHYVNGVLTIGLCGRDGEIKSCELNVNEERLREVIKERIDKGVRNFFESWRLAVVNMKNANDMEKFYIFLGGNSSKSNFVKESFEKHITTLAEELEDSKLKDMFEIFPPLGTAEAKVIQEERGGSLYEEIIEPTGKTGVAYGLIRSRESGKIKVIKRESNHFKFFVGLERRRKFKLVMGRDTELNTWIEFMTADRKEFEIFYTDLPEANSGELLVKNIKKINCNIEDTDEEKNIYIRAISNTEIEYTVANEEEIKDLNYSGKTYKKELQ